MFRAVNIALLAGLFGVVTFGCGDDDGSGSTGGTGGSDASTGIGTGGTAGGGGTGGEGGVDGSGAGSGGIDSGTGGAEIVGMDASKDAGQDAQNADASDDDGGGTADAGDSGMTYGIEGQSCEGAGKDCNDNGTAVSCCDAKLVVGGTYLMGRCGVEGAGCSDEYDGFSNELPEHEATVADFYLDTFEVTVGRFRRFVDQYDGTPPPLDAGANPLIPGSGWQSDWRYNLWSTQSSLKASLSCDTTNETWTYTPGANEQYPINCVNWYQAFAFCIWDGARLPTEAEWEYAAAGGSENRLYPWGAEAPDVVPLRANYVRTGRSAFIEVGSYPAGVGRWGQHDLVGSTWEWVLDRYDTDWYSGEGNPCDNCANLYGSPSRTWRGGDWNDGIEDIRAARRSIAASNIGYYSNIGFRCARTP